VNELRRAWGPSAITRWSVITGVVVMIVLALPAGQQAEGFALPTRLLTALAAAVAGALVLAAAGATWLRPVAAGQR